METETLESQTAIDMESLMRKALEIGASDIHIKVGNPPIFRVDGELSRLDADVLTEDDVTKLIREIASPADFDRYEKVMELDSSYMLNDVARFRVNACKDDGDSRIVLRVIPIKIKTIDDLDLPLVIKKFCALKNGLVLVTGPTGSGKSTTLAGMVEEINTTRAIHIVTIEDPLEFVHQDKTAIITQREVGHDTLSFANALRASLRQDPDVILIGEMRDAETVRSCLAAAETGHLVLSTLHTVDAVETLNRIIDFFEPHQQIQIRKQIASVLRGIISQRILPRKETSGRCAAVEILIGTRTVREYIETGKSFRDIVKLIEEGGSQYGMQTFDQALFDLTKADTITMETAMTYATSPKDLKLRFQGLAHT